MNLCLLEVIGFSSRIPLQLKSEVASKEHSGVHLCLGFASTTTKTNSTTLHNNQHHQTQHRLDNYYPDDPRPTSGSPTLAPPRRTVVKMANHISEPAAADRGRNPANERGRGYNWRTTSLVLAIT
ncbi:unnamed protein product [Nezara viridula]|uniref:Uncharacterized protein n=1 Tax=Nezara viridula TaxID=85310 RepID=A0A9P0HN83_NEZVI|nr:unnamed protein product [Nezara viridula]